MKFLNLLTLLLLVWINIFGQKINLKGFVYDSINGNPVVAVTILNNGEFVAKTDNSGYFDFFIPKGRNKISFYRVGYKDFMLETNFSKDTLLTVLISPADYYLTTVSVSASSRKYLHSDLLSVAREDLNFLPSVAGETDLLKSAQKLPGLSFSNEGTANIVIRGGSPDQTLYLIDGVPVCFIRHFGGFLSVVDPNVVNSINIYKDYVPPYYNNKLSGVVDFSLKNGNFSKFEKALSLGLFTSGFYSAIPIVKNKNSLMFSFRTSPIGYGLKFLSKNIAENFSVYYNIYDFTLKYSHKLSSKTSFSVLYFFNSDVIKSKLNDHKVFQEFTQSWKNNLFSVRFNTLIFNKIYSNFIFGVNGNFFRNQSFGKFDTLINENGFGSHLIDYFFRQKNRIKISENVNFTFGINSSRIKYVPLETLNHSVPSPVTKVSNYNLFAETKYKKSIFSLKVGINANFTFLSDTVFINPEPRLVLKINLSGHSVLNTGFSSASQNIHFISGIFEGYPVDFWLLANKKFPFEKAESFFINYSFLNDDFFLKTSLFYKRMFGLTGIKDIYFWEAPTNWYNVLAGNGSGKAYGMEFLVKKITGKNNGWISIAYIRSFRKFPAINRGLEYPYEYDRPLKIDLVYKRAINKRIIFSATWTYASGLPYTKPVGYAVLPTAENDPESGYFDSYIIWQERNSSKLKDYHRLDVAFNFVKKSKTHQRNLSVGIINLYNRKNIYYYTISKVKDGGNKLHWEIKYLTLFPFMPFVSYSVKF